MIEHNLPVSHLIQKTEDFSDSLTARLRITFTNGYALSVIKGEFTYGSDQGLFEIAPLNLEGKLDGSLFDEADQGDDVLGYCTAAQVGHYIEKLSKL